MSSALPVHEPTMDEILASIRKIIETGDERVAPYRQARVAAVDAQERMAPKIVASDGKALAGEAAFPEMTPAPAAEVAVAAAPAPSKLESGDGFFAEFDEESFASELLARVDDEPLPTKQHNPANDAGDFENAPGSTTFEDVREELRLRAADLCLRDPSVTQETRSVSQDASKDGVGDAEAQAPVQPETPPITASQSRPVTSHDLVSAKVEDIVGASFHDLATAVWDEQRHRAGESVQAMIRPMLQEWLDENLPYIVENLVREEIERIARGPR